MRLFKKTSYQIQSGAPNCPPKCPECGACRWVASRPSRIRKQKHPQDSTGWFDRALRAFVIGFVGCSALAGLAVIGSPVFPEWAIWIIGCAGAALMTAALVVADGIAVESKSCHMFCKECGNSFDAPWRPGA